LGTGVRGTSAAEDTEPALVAPVAVPVTSAARVAAALVEALVGTEICAWS
jgi:hypothetical protein